MIIWQISDQECYCRTLDRKALNNSLQDQLVNTRDNPLGANELTAVSATPVFVLKRDRSNGANHRSIESTAVNTISTASTVVATQIVAFDPGQ